jgi:hypothetical protein
MFVLKISGWGWYWITWLLFFIVPELWWVFHNPANTLSQKFWTLESLNTARPFDFGMWTDVHWALASIIWLLFLWLSLHLPFGLLR